MKINFDAHENIRATRAAERKPLLCFMEDIGLLGRNPAFLPKKGGLIRFDKRLYPVINV